MIKDRILPAMLVVTGLTGCRKTKFYMIGILRVQIIRHMAVSTLVWRTGVACLMTAITIRLEMSTL